MRPFPGGHGEPISGPTWPQTVTGLVNGGRRIRSGSSEILTRSGGITDAAGNALDGGF